MAINHIGKLSIFWRVLLLFGTILNRELSAMEPRWPDILGISADADEGEVREAYENRKIINIMCSCSPQAKKTAEWVLERALAQGEIEVKDPIEALSQELIYEKQIVPFSRLKVQLDQAKSSFHVIAALSLFFQSSIKESTRLQFEKDQKIFKQKLVHNFYPFITVILSKALDVRSNIEIDYHDIHKAIVDLSTLNSGIELYFDKDCLTVWELKKRLFDIMYEVSRDIVRSSNDLKRICAGYCLIVECVGKDENVITNWLLKEHSEINAQQKADIAVDLRIEALNEVLNTHLLSKITSIESLPFDICSSRPLVSRRSDQDKPTRSSRN